MKFRSLNKWSFIILSIFFNLHCIQCTDNSRSQKSLQPDYSEVISDFDSYADDDFNEQDRVSNDYKNADVEKYTSFKNNKKNHDETSSTKLKINNGPSIKQVTDLDLAKFELEKVGKNVESEIHYLDEFYETAKAKKRDISEDKKIISPSKLVENDVENKNPVLLNLNKKKQPMSKSLDNINKLQSSGKSGQSKTRMKTSRRSNEEETEMEIQKKIDGIKAEVKLQMEAEQKRKVIKRNNARYDELQRMNSVEIQSKNDNKSLKSAANNGLSIADKNIHKRSTSIDKKNKIRKSIAKNVNHLGAKKLKKSIHKADKIFVKIKNESPNDLDVQQQLTALKSKSASNRMTRRLRKRPGDPRKYHRFTRRLRKPPGIEHRSLEKQKNRRVINKKNGKKNYNFLFHKNHHQKRATVLSNPSEKLDLPRKKNVERAFKHNHKKEIVNRLENTDEFRERTEQDLDNLLDGTNYNSAIKFNGLDNVANPQDMTSQLVSEYEGVFGGLSNNPDDTSLLRFKRVKRA